MQLSWIVPASSPTGAAQRLIKEFTKVSLDVCPTTRRESHAALVDNFIVKLAIFFLNIIAFTVLFYSVSVCLLFPV